MNFSSTLLKNKHKLLSFTDLCSFIMREKVRQLRFFRFMVDKNVFLSSVKNMTKIEAYFIKISNVIVGKSGGGGHFLVNCVPMREQRTAKLILNSLSDILKFIPPLTVSSQKVTLFNVVN